MRTKHIPKLAVWLAAMAAALPGTCRAVEGNEAITAVASRASRDYVRLRLPDGTFQPEQYAFGDGGRYPDPFQDDSIDKMTFDDVARVIAGPLAEQRYFPAKDPKTTRLLIMLYWGTTTVSPDSSMSPGYTLYESASTPTASSPGPSRVGQSMAGSSATNNSAADEALAMMDMENRARDKLDFSNAQMLGYNSDGMIGTLRGDAIRHSALRDYRAELVSEIEQNRYFVVLMAYDFQVLMKEKKHVLLWETRFSISQRRNAFDRALPAMASYASRYFGQDSNGLVRKPVPVGKVEVGEPTVIEMVHTPDK